MEEKITPPNDTAVTNTGNQSGFKSLFPTKEQWQIMEFMAKTFRDAGAMPKGIDTVPKLMVVLQAGIDCGLTPLASLNSFYFVNGNVRIWGEQKIAQVLKAGHTVYWGNVLDENGDLKKTAPCSKTYASITIKRKDTGQMMSAELSMAEASARGMDKGPNGIKDTWRKYPENMLKFKVFDMVAKFLVSDALQGVQIDDDEDVVQVEVTAVPEVKNSLQDALNKPVEEVLPKKEKSTKKVKEPAREEQPPVEPTA